MKKSIQLPLAALLAATMTITAFAQESQATQWAQEPSDDLVITVTDGVLGLEQQPSENNSTTKSTVRHYPFEIRHETFGDSLIVIKSYKVPTGYDPILLIEADFVDGAYKFTHKDILRKEPDVKTETKLAAQTVTFRTPDNEQATILAGLSPLMQYDEDGFSGQLELDYSSIQSLPEDKTSFSYPIRKTVEYKNLAQNDYAYIDKSLDGLSLQNVEWVAAGGAQRGEQIVPGSYTAKATYTGTGYGTKVTEYQNTAVYKGLVSRTVPEGAVVSIVYQGEPINEVKPWVVVLICVVFLFIIWGISKTAKPLER